MLNNFFLQHIFFVDISLKPEYDIDMMNRNNSLGGNMKFKKDQFNYFGGYLHYTDDNGTKRFVARFKYAQTSSRGTWVTFMIKHFTVEEYFLALADSSPIQVMQGRGYVLSHIKKWMKQDGWTDLTHAGYKAWSSWRRDETANVAQSV